MKGVKKEQIEEFEWKSREQAHKWENTDMGEEEKVEGQIAVGEEN